ncbi:MAG: ring-cleaving dioxygenase [Kurthia sp.]|nr:ring-cleaving dioxygenase [Candidatus Kurthia equi]
MTLKLGGIHHVSSITSHIERNHDFFTRILGMRLVKKTVNQDNTSSYHLFYADAVGSPGTDMTYFDIPIAGRTYEGVSSINNTAFRITSNEALDFWVKRFDEFGVQHGPIEERFGRKTVQFRDEDLARFILVVDDGTTTPYGVPWEVEGIPLEYAIVGLGGVTLTLRDAEKTEKILTDFFGFEKVGTYPSLVENQPDIVVYSTGLGGPAGEIHIEQRSDLPIERPGRGSVHHVALRINNFEEYDQWMEKFDKLGYATSGKVDRFYFRSIYYRDPNGILFELATDQPGFDVDEPMEALGAGLALPSFLESKRAEIEAKLHPLSLDEK